MQVAFVVEGERETDSYGIRLLVVKRSSAGSCKLIRPSIFHRTITD